MDLSAGTPDRWRATAQTGPWLGLESYREADSDRFFGRETETEELFRMVRREVLSVLFGPSGIGKTSLLRAGLFARLARENYFPVYIRASYKEGVPPVAEQARASIQEALRNRNIDEEFSGERSAETLWEYLHTADFWDRSNRILTPVLFFDQFEEMFTLGAGTIAAAEFERDLADLVENYLPKPVSARWEATGAKIPERFRTQNYKIVITLREDFVHRLDGLRKSIPSIMQNRYPLAQLNGNQALDAVLKPGAGIVTEPVARQIVHFVAATSARTVGIGERGADLSELRVEPALLSVVCQELCSRAPGAEKQITSAAVDAARGDVLDNFYERSFEGMPPEARVFIEDRLLTQSGFRNTAPLEDAHRSGLGDPVISALIDRRLIRVEQRLGISHLELTHDLLAKVVDASRKSRHERERRLAAERDREAQAKALRRSRLVLLVLAIATLASLVLGGIALNSRRKAKEAEATANLLRARAEVAESRAKQAEQLAQSRMGIDYLANQVKAATEKGDTQAAHEYTVQLKALQNQIAIKTAQPYSAAPPPGILPAQNANKALEAALKPEQVLATSDIDATRFISGFGAAFRPMSARTKQAVTRIIEMLNRDPAFTDIRKAAYLLATISWETGQSFVTDQEKGTEEAFSRYGPDTRLGKMLGNTEPGDGYRYRGRGYVFLTGKGNYAKYGKLMDVGDQFVENPDLLLDPDIAYRLTSRAMTEGWFSGRKLGDFIAGGTADYVNARRVVNGLDHALEIAQSATRIEQLLASSLEAAKTSK